MSGNLWFYIKMVAVSVADLWIGSTIGYLNDKFFADKYNTATSPKDRFTQNILVASAQGATAVITSDQIRGLIYPPNFEDPTGGIVFIASLFLTQTNLWKRIDEIAAGFSTIMPEILLREKALIMGGEEKSDVLMPNPMSKPLFHLQEASGLNKH